MGSSNPGSVNSRRIQIYPGECTQCNLTSELSLNYSDNDPSVPEFSRFLLVRPLYSMLVRLSWADWERVISLSLATGSGCLAIPEAKGGVVL